MIKLKNKYNILYKLLFVKIIKFRGYMRNFFYKVVENINSKKVYICGIPYSSYQKEGKYTTKRTFFNIIKEKKDRNDSKYYFLGFQIWSKEKSKNDILQELNEYKSYVESLRDELEIQKYKWNSYKNTKEEQLEDINICLILDNNYVIPTIVAITSAILNKDTSSIYNFYLIVDNLSKENIAKIKQLEQKKVNINIINTDISKYKNIFVHTHVSKTACLKFDIPNLLNLDKVLYLDGDIIVRKDLKDLYKKDISNYYLAAVRDMGGELGQHFNTTIGVEKYFNSGILLLNLDKIRRENLSKQFIEIKLAHPDWVCMDQDVKALIKTGAENGCDMSIIKSADETNKKQRALFVDKITKKFGDNLAGKTFAVWGLAFKPKTNDMREAPAITIINNLSKLGAKINAYDPKATEEAKFYFKDTITYVKSSYEALENLRDKLVHVNLREKIKLHKVALFCTRGSLVVVLDRH